MDLKVWCYDLRIGNSQEQDFLAQNAPRISWKVGSSARNAKMAGYEINIAGNQLFTEKFFTTGIVWTDESVNIPWPTEPLSSYEEVYVRVRCRVGDDWSKWCETLKGETSLFEDQTWPAEFITLPDDVGSRESGPTILLRKEIFLEQAPAKIRIYATAKGIFTLLINGQPASDTFFEPGWTDYSKEFPVKGYDVTNLFRKGNNVIGVILGDGWFRGKLGWEALRCSYGESISFSCEIKVEENDLKFSVNTDSSWRTHTGHVLSADIYDGAHIDYSKALKDWHSIGFDASEWKSAKIDLKPSVKFVPITVPPIRVSQTIVPKLVDQENADIFLFDVGRNVTGWVQLKVRGKKGQMISVRHGEILDKENSLYVKNLRKAKAIDTYLLDCDEDVLLEPIFTFHGFQYFEVSGSVTIVNCSVKVIHSDIKERATLRSSNVLLNTLFQNIKNSQKANFISIPTDCPQRDERLGWTGDIAAFAKTAVVLYDVKFFLKSWLRQLSNSQLENGAVTNVVPNVLGRYFVNPDDVAGLMAWGDASTIVPWCVYLSYGDLEVLEDQLSSMAKWLNYLESLPRVEGLLCEDSNQIGDWLDPDAPEGQPQNAQVPTLFIMNAFYSYSSLLLGKVYKELGQNQIAEIHFEKAQKIASLTWQKWKFEIVKSMTGCALAIEFQIAPESESELVAVALVGLIENNNSKISTGLIGTARILHALAHSDKMKSAFDLLFNPVCPGWMHQVLQGASTIWERWDSKHEDGSIDEEPHYWNGENVGMNSFNHYHLGSIGDWILEYVGGIGLMENSPGYRRISFSPSPTKEVTWCNSALETQFGTATNEWEIKNDMFEMQIGIPVGIQGLIKIPFGFRKNIKLENSAIENFEFTLGSGSHLITSQRS